MTKHLRIPLQVSAVCAAMALAALGTPAQARVTFDLGIAVPPIVEYDEAPPAGYVWAPGHWEWRYDHREWIPGHYVPALVGSYRHWVPGYWVEGYYGHHYVRGHWEY